MPAIGSPLGACEKATVSRAPTATQRDGLGQETPFNGTESGPPSSGSAAAAARSSSTPRLHWRAGGGPRPGRSAPCADPRGACGRRRRGLGCSSRDGIPSSARQRRVSQPWALRPPALRRSALTRVAGLPPRGVKVTRRRSLRTPRRVNLDLAPARGRTASFDASRGQGRSPRSPDALARQGKLARAGHRDGQGRGPVPAIQLQPAEPESAVGRGTGRGRRWRWRPALQPRSVGGSRTSPPRIDSRSASGGTARLRRSPPRTNPRRPSPAPRRRST